MEGRDRRGRACAGGTRQGGIPTQQRTRLLVFARAGSDAVVRGLPIHCGPRNVLDLIGYVIDDGQLFGAGRKCIWDFFSHFLTPLFLSSESVLKSVGPTLMPLVLLAADND